MFFPAADSLFAAWYFVPPIATDVESSGTCGPPTRSDEPTPALKPMQMKVRLSFRTDIGGMSENQDNCFIWRHEPSGSFVIGVLDGHGRDVGRLAAHVVQAFMQDWLTRRWGEVKANPAEAFRTLFKEIRCLETVIWCVADVLVVVVDVVDLVGEVAVEAVVVVESRRAVHPDGLSERLRVGITLANMTPDLLWRQTAVPQLGPREAPSRWRPGAPQPA
eukprot:jgi/Undpi1/4822/HiC_scaffold_19.g08175.m1